MFVYAGLSVVRVVEFVICWLILLMFSMPQQLQINSKCENHFVDCEKMKWPKISLSWFQMICKEPSIDPKKTEPSEFLEKFNEKKYCDAMNFSQGDAFPERKNLAKGPRITDERFCKVKLCQYVKNDTSDDESCVCWHDPWFKIVYVVTIVTMVWIAVDFVVIVVMYCKSSSRSVFCAVGMGVCWIFVSSLWVGAIVVCIVLVYLNWQYKYEFGGIEYFYYSIPTMYYAGFGLMCAMLIFSLVNIFDRCCCLSAFSKPTAEGVKGSKLTIRSKGSSISDKDQPKSAKGQPKSHEGQSKSDKRQPKSDKDQVKSDKDQTKTKSDKGQSKVTKGGASKSPVKHVKTDFQAIQKSTAKKHSAVNIREQRSTSSKSGSNKEGPPPQGTVVKAPFFDIVTKPNFELQFVGPRNQPSIIELTLHNPNHAKLLAYTIRVSHPDDYVVNPKDGVLESSDIHKIRITRKISIKERLTDKAVLTYIQVSPGTRTVNEMMFQDKTACKRKEFLIKH